MDEITIRGLRGRGFHGVLAAEKRDGQEFVVDVMLGVDIARAAASDDVQDTIDYSAVAEAVHAVITGKSLDLIETLAERCASVCLGFAGVQQVEIIVHKPHAPIAVQFDDVSVRIVRQR